MSPCPHMRPSWRMCPHCLGVNAMRKPMPRLDDTARPEAEPKGAQTTPIPGPLSEGGEQ